MKWTCKDCKDRHPHCHDECDIYQAGIKENERIKELRALELGLEHAAYRQYMYSSKSLERRKN